MSEKNNSFRVFIDSNVLISAMRSQKSLSSKLLHVLIKDIPILVSALIAQPDIFISGDYDFHTPEIREHFAVYTPADFLKSFGIKLDH